MFWKDKIEWITTMEEEFIICVLHNRKVNLGYGDCSEGSRTIAPNDNCSPQPQN